MEDVQIGTSTSSEKNSINQKMKIIANEDTKKLANKEIKQMSQAQLPPKQIKINQ